MDNEEDIMLSSDDEKFVETLHNQEPEASSSDSESDVGEIVVKPSVVMNKTMRWAIMSKSRKELIQKFRNAKELADHLKVPPQKVYDYSVGRTFFELSDPDCLIVRLKVSQPDQEEFK